MLKTLSYLIVKFISLANLQDEELLDELININSYQINLENFKIVLKHQDISIGKLKEHKVAYEYCFTDGNLELLVNKVLLQLDKYNETEDIFIELIEELILNRNLEETNIFSLIESWTGSVTNLSQIETPSFIKLLSDAGKFELTWDNIQYCYEVFNEANEAFSLNSLIFNKSRLDELILYSSKEVQNKFISETKYNSFVTLILNLDNKKIEDFISILHYPVNLHLDDLANENIFSTLV